MSCCGRKRAQFQAYGGLVSSQLPSFARPQPQSARLRRSGIQAKIVFQYTGRSAMAVIGPVSGIRYSFADPGARVEVDPRDCGSLVTVPNLRRVN
jgi:hypothetical protein